MVMLSPSNTTSIVFAVNLYKQESSFSLVPDWLKKRKELPPGYKHYYAEIQRKIGNRGFVFLQNETLAEILACHPKTIQNYNSISAKHNLITIVHTGRGSLFVLNYHPWMEISEVEARKFVPSLPEKILHLISKKAPSEEQNFPNNTLQTAENQEDSEPREILLENPIEIVRSMHASEAGSNSNITDSNISEQKETCRVDANTTTNIKDEITKDNQLQEIKLEAKVEETPESVYPLEVIIKFVLAYAMMKLGTNDEIKDHRAFGTYCLETGEKDPWIAEFIKNGYVLSPVNPLKDYQVKQPGQTQQTQSQPKAKKISPKQARRMKQQSDENIELKGKYPYQVYLDFANYELKQKKNIGSIDGFTNWLQRTGAQDDTQVAQFVELMKQTLVGSHKQNNTLPLEQSQEEKERLAQEATRIQELLAIDSLGVQAWDVLNQDQKQQILDIVVPEYKQKHPQVCAKMTSDGLRVHIVGLIKPRLGEMLYKANVRNLTSVETITEVLELRGKELFEGMDDWEQADLIESKIEGLGENYYGAESEYQQKLLDNIKSHIYWELAGTEIAEVG